MNTEHYDTRTTKLTPEMDKQQNIERNANKSKQRQQQQTIKQQQKKIIQKILNSYAAEITEMVYEIELTSSLP